MRQTSEQKWQSDGKCAVAIRPWPSAPHAMKLLLDTHILLWWVEDNQRLPVRLQKKIASHEGEIFVSAATGWEVVMKAKLGKLPIPPETVPLLRKLITASGFLELAITLDHALLAGNLPIEHKDPFDRVIIAQAMLEGLTIVSIDKALPRYRVSVLG